MGSGTLNDPECSTSAIRRCMNGRRRITFLIQQWGNVHINMWVMHILILGRSIKLLLILQLMSLITESPLIRVVKFKLNFSSVFSSVPLRESCTPSLYFAGCGAELAEGFTLTTGMRCITFRTRGPWVSLLVSSGDKARGCRALQARLWTI